MSKSLPAVIQIRCGSSFCGQKLTTGFTYARTFLLWRHDISCRVSWQKLHLLLFGLSCSTPVSYPQSPPKHSLPYLGHCQIVHQLLITWIFLPVTGWTIGLAKCSKLWAEVLWYLVAISVKCVLYWLTLVLEWQGHLLSVVWQLFVVFHLELRCMS